MGSIFDFGGSPDPWNTSVDAEGLGNKFRLATTGNVNGLDPATAGALQQGIQGIGGAATQGPFSAAKTQGQQQPGSGPAAPPPVPGIPADTLKALMVSQAAPKPQGHAGIYNFGEHKSPFAPAA